VSNRQQPDTSPKMELLRFAFLALLGIVLSTAIGKKLFTEGLVAGSQIVSRPFIENLRHTQDRAMQIARARMTVTERQGPVPSGQGLAPDVSLALGSMGTRLLPVAPGESISLSVSAATPPADILVAPRGVNAYRDFHFQSDVSPPIAVTLPLSQTAQPGACTAVVVCKDRSGNLSKPAEVDFQVEARTAGGG